MSNLAAVRERVEQLLVDTANAIYPAALIDEAIRLALDQYNLVNPLGTETIITLPGDGREIALEALSGLLYVVEVWWPYDSSAACETWPPNKVQGFRLWWDDARPVLFLDIPDGAQPQLVGYPFDPAEVQFLPGAEKPEVFLGVPGLNNGLSVTIDEYCRRRTLHGRNEIF